MSKSLVLPPIINANLFFFILLKSFLNLLTAILRFLLFILFNAPLIYIILLLNFLYFGNLS